LSLIFSVDPIRIICSAKRSTKQACTTQKARWAKLTDINLQRAAKSISFCCSLKKILKLSRAALCCAAAGLAQSISYQLQEGNVARVYIIDSILFNPVPSIPESQIKKLYHLDRSIKQP